ncbi:MAG: arylsulfotransferase family protein [Gemmatimonadaceae bacterium]
MPRLGGRSAALVVLLGVSGLALGCDTLVDPATPCLTPKVGRSSVRSNTNNVLSAIVSAEVHGADSVAVRFGRTTAPTDIYTPAVGSLNGEVAIPLFGLYPGADYSLQVMAFSTCGHSIGEVLAYTTHQLSMDLPAYTASGTDPSPGYVAFASRSFGIVIDNTGRVVWYHRFPDGPGLNFQPQPNGRYAARPSPATPGDLALWTEIDPLGDVTRTLGCARGLQPRFHDLLAQPDGSYWLLCDQPRTVNLTAAGGPAQQLVLGTGIQHQSAAGEVLFEWTPFDHFEVDLQALEPADRTGPMINWTHGNALDLDTDGNLLVSFRNLSEVTKINTRNGAVMWRMGGSRNQFTFVNTTAPAFARQHSIRATGAGQFLLLDNLGNTLGSRAERYEYDEARRIVRASGSHASSTGAVAQTGGSTQSLPGGRTLVSFGSGGSVEEYDAEGNVVWRIEGNPGYVFRAHRIRSLYQPGVGDPR